MINCIKCGKDLPDHLVATYYHQHDNELLHRKVTAAFCRNCKINVVDSDEFLPAVSRFAVEIKRDIKEGND